jgi:hypothetical protein
MWLISTSFYSRPLRQSPPSIPQQYGSMSLRGMVSGLAGQTRSNSVGISFLSCEEGCYIGDKLSFGPCLCDAGADNARPFPNVAPTSGLGGCISYPRAFVGSFLTEEKPKLAQLGVEWAETVVSFRSTSTTAAKRSVYTTIRVYRWRARQVLLLWQCLFILWGYSLLNSPTAMIYSPLTLLSFPGYGIGT